MLRDLRSALIALVVLTVAFGIALPALFTGFAQVAFKSQANGSLITQNGQVVGSKLAAQSFTKPQYFHERPSATAPAYNAGATTFANLGPTNPELAKNVRTAANAILKLESPYNPGLTIAPAYAHLQSKRVATVRHLPLATVQRLVAKFTDGRSLGVLGEPGVNVLELNLALDKEGR
jgi:K+-transporting ATPase ATPase C chain